MVNAINSYTTKAKALGFPEVGVKGEGLVTQGYGVPGGRTYHNMYVVLYIMPPRPKFDHSSYMR